MSPADSVVAGVIVLWFFVALIFEPVAALVEELKSYDTRQLAGAVLLTLVAIFTVVAVLKGWTGCGYYCH